MVSDKVITWFLFVGPLLAYVGGLGTFDRISIYFSALLFPVAATRCSHDRLYLLCNVGDGRSHQGGQAQPSAG